VRICVNKLQSSCMHLTCTNHAGSFLHACPLFKCTHPLYHALLKKLLQNTTYRFMLTKKYIISGCCCCGKGFPLAGDNGMVLLPGYDPCHFYNVDIGIVPSRFFSTSDLEPVWFFFLATRPYSVDPRLGQELTVPCSE
jgi:hypothetical protein